MIGGKLEKGIEKNKGGIGTKHFPYFYANTI